MIKIHMLNVKQGDCFLFERSTSKSDRLTMIDICCGNLASEELMKSSEAMESSKPHGNFGMCKKPTNPFSYMRNRYLTNVFRFILTHPDMDHMDGIRKLFEDLNVTNFWDCGIRREKPDFGGSPYDEDDWDFYDDLINGRVNDVTVVSPRSGSKGKFWNQDDDGGSGNGDYIQVVAPNEDLVELANENGDINDASYVLVYRSSAGPIIFSGDSNDNTWEHILDNHTNLVENAAVLFAPHHGRKSKRSYEFLKVVKPRVTFFGCAPSDDLAYSGWNSRNLVYFTNNQCGNVHIYPDDKTVSVFIENGVYADAYTDKNTYQKDSFWYLDTF